MLLCVKKLLDKQILTLNCRLQIQHVKSDCVEFDDPLALAFCSLHILSASQILFASNCAALLFGITTLLAIVQPVARTSWNTDVRRRGFKGVFVAFLLAFFRVFVFIWFLRSFFV